MPKYIELIQNKFKNFNKGNKLREKRDNMIINTELKSRNINFKNRIIMPPMATAKADERGYVTEGIIDYYREKTKSGLIAAVITEHSYVEKRGQAHKNQLSIAEDGTVEGLKKLADTIHSNGSLAVAQLAHAGTAAKEEVTGEKPAGPSAISNPGRKDSQNPRELSAEEIKEIAEKFAEAAVRAEKAGFDGVEIHSAHGYLLNQFLSPLTNKRKDEYGGKIENRVKIHVEIIRKIKNLLGESYPVFIRMGAGDFMENGLTEEDSVKAAKLFEKAGADVIDISGGMCSYHIEDTRPGYFDVLSEPVYKNVNIPVILTGGVKKGEDIEDILERKVCSLVGVGRSLLNNSDWMEEEVAKYF